MWSCQGSHRSSVVQNSPALFFWRSGGCILSLQQATARFSSPIYVRYNHPVLSGPHFTNQSTPTMAIINLTALFSRILSNLPYISLALLFWVACVAVYRVYFSPLSHVPGPKLAAVTTRYEFYHDCIHLGQFIFRLDELHKQYGMKVPTSCSQRHAL